MESVQRHLHCISQCGGQLVFWNCIKAICNAWPTTARTLHLPARCVYQCKEGTDTFMHYCQCRHFRDALHVALPRLPIMEPSRLLLLQEDLTAEDCPAIGLWHCCALASYNTFRLTTHTDCTSVIQFLQARCRFLAAQNPALRKWVQQFKGASFPLHP